MNKSHHKKFYLAEEQSLLLSYPKVIDFPEAVPPQDSKSLLSLYSLKSLLMNTNTNYSSKKNKQKLIEQIVPILSQYILMMYGNKLYIYHYERNTQSQKQSSIQCELLLEIKLQFYCKQIQKFNSEKFNNDKYFYFCAIDTSSQKLQLFYFDCLLKECSSIKTLKAPTQINCLSFVAVNQIIFWCNNMHIYHFQVSKTGFRQISAINSQVNPDSQFNSQQQSKYSPNCKNTKNPFQTLQNKSFILSYSKILGIKDPEQDTILVLFYILYNQQFNLMKIKCRQILYPMQQLKQKQGYSLSSILKFASRSAQQQIKMVTKQNINSENQDPYCSYQIISQNMHNSQVLQCLNIIQIEHSYLVKLEYEIIVIEKKYGKYYAIDNIYKKNKDCDVIMAQNSSIIACIFEDILQINQIMVDVGETRTQAKMIDFIDLTINSQQKTEESPEKHRRRCKQLSRIKNNKQKCELKQNKSMKHPKVMKKLKCLWIADGKNNNKHQNSPFLIFELQTIANDKQYERQICLYQAKPIPKLTKLTNLAKVTKHEEELIQIEKIGENIGIDPTQFYFNLWKQSSQSYEDIKDYLIKCDDYTIIFEQLKEYLKRRDLTIAQLYQFLRRIKKIAFIKTKKQLSDKVLEDYFKICFTLRKFKIYSNQYEINEKQFTKCVQSSLYDIIFQIINLKLFPIQKKLSPWEAEQKQPPKIDLLQLLHEFKLPLRENYLQFLQKILEKYSNHIIKIISTFPMFLPNFPLEQSTDYIGMSESLVNYNTDFHQNQQGIFSSIFFKDLKSEEFLLENVSNELQNYFPTSQIQKTIKNTLLRPDIKNKKYFTHLLIRKPSSEYVKDIKSLTAESIYLIVLKNLVLNANQMNKKANISELLNFIQTRYKIPQILKSKLHLISSLYELFLKNSMINNETSIFDLYDEPIEKWIAFFFLGNKQKKGLIFTQFYQIFENQNQFIKVFGKYINSEQCSKIQLSFLTDMVSRHMEELQQQPYEILCLEEKLKHKIGFQEIIQLIVDGFCSKIYINEKADCKTFLKRIKSVKLSPKMIIKLQKIQNLIEWIEVFDSFNMSEKPIIQFLSQTTEIMNEMLEKFFNQQVQKKIIRKKIGKNKRLSLTGSQNLQIKKQDQRIEISDPLSMINLLYKLRQEIFWQITDQQLVLLYSYKLVQWQRFDEVKQFLYNSDQIKLFENLNVHNIVFLLIQLSLNQLYSNQNLYFDQETIAYVRNIIDIDIIGESNPLVAKQKAKIQLVQLFNSWKESDIKQERVENSQIQMNISYSAQKKCSQKQQDIDYQKQQGLTIKLYNLQAMCTLWQNQIQQNPNSISQKTVMLEIIENYGHYINLTALKLIYKCFTIITESIRVLNNNEQIYQCPQFYCYCQKLAENLLPRKRFSQISQILSEINIKYQLNYQLNIECMLNCLISQFLSVKSQNQQKILKQICKISMKKKKKEQIDPLLVPTQAILISHQKLQKCYGLQKVKGLVFQIDQRLVINKIKRYIDFFVQQWSHQNFKKLNMIYQYKLIPDMSDRQEEFLYANNEICYENHKCKIATDDLWDFIIAALASQQKEQRSKILSKRIIQKQISIESIAYAYFFITMGLADPKTGFEIIENIRYNHEDITKIFSVFEYHCTDIIQQLSIINDSAIFLIYLNALVKEMMRQKRIKQNFCFEQDFTKNKINQESIEENYKSKHLATSSFIPAQNSLIQEVGLSQYQPNMIKSSKNNFQQIRSQIRGNFFKDNTFSKVVLKMIDLYLRSIKKEEKSHKISKFYEVTQKKIKDQSIQIQPLNDSQLKQERQSRMYKTLQKIQPQSREQPKLSLHDFYLLKKDVYQKIKNDKGVRPSEKQIANSIIKYYANGQQSVQGLHNILQQSMTELIDKDSPLKKKLFRQKQLANRDKSSQTISQLIADNKILDRDFSNLEDSQLIEIIQNSQIIQLKNQPFSTFINRLQKLYDNPQLSLTMILKSMYELSYRNKNKAQQEHKQFSANKIQTLLLAEPQKYQTNQNNMQFKNIISFEYLLTQFSDSLKDHQMIIFERLNKIIHNYSKKELMPFIQYISEVQKIQYRRLPSSIYWYQGKIGEQYLLHMATRPDYTPENVTQIDEIIRFVGKKGYQFYLKEHKSRIHQTFLQKGCEQLANWLVKCLQMQFQEKKMNQNNFK